MVWNSACAGAVQATTWSVFVAQETGLVHTKAMDETAEYQPQVLPSTHVFEVMVESADGVS